MGGRASGVLEEGNHICTHLHIPSEVGSVYPARVNPNDADLGEIERPFRITAAKA